MKLKLNDIHIDGGTQPREDIDIDTVADYVQAMQDGDVFPPVVVFNDGAKYWLADGFHRYHASNQIGYLEIEAEVHSGTKRDAVLYSVSANTKHGLRRTNADKRKAVLTLLNDEKWATWPQVKIAEHCSVSPEYVSRLKKRESDNITIDRSIVETSDGRMMDTSNIGKKNIFGKKITAEDSDDLPDNVDAETGEVLDAGSHLEFKNTETTVKEGSGSNRTERKGIGLQKAHEAIAILKQIPPNDDLLQEGYDIVIQWINHNR